MKALRPSPYREPSEPERPPPQQNRFADGCVMACVIATWSVFITHFGGAVWRAESLWIYAPLGVVLLGVSFFLVGAATGDADST
jgi:hypothetical protein